MKRPISIDDCIPTPAELERQAWAWLRLLGSGKATQQDADHFRRWVQSDSAHRAAYDKVKRLSDVMKPSIGALRHSDPQIAALHARRLPRPLSSRRQFLGAAVGVAAAASVAIVYPPFALWPTPSEWSADDRTAKGEQRTLALDDRVKVTLNTETSIRRRHEGNETVGFELVRGEAAVDLTRSARPFGVVAGVGSSSAQAGQPVQFQVRYLDDKVCVTCIEGELTVEHPAGARMLQARQQTIYDARTISGTAGIDPQKVAAWRDGVLVLDETRLADAIEEINRYRSGRVVLMNDAVRDKPVSGTFSIKSLDQALLEMQQVFGLQARSLVGGVVVLS
jgi:transmembrane sensor